MPALLLLRHFSSPASNAFFGVLARAVNSGQRYKQATGGLYNPGSRQRDRGIQNKLIQTEEHLFIYQSKQKEKERGNVRVLK